MSGKHIKFADGRVIDFDDENGAKPYPATSRAGGVTCATEQTISRPLDKFLLVEGR